MELVNWYKFNIKNEHFTKAFEEMCLNLFIRNFGINLYDLQGDFNHPGLETKPIKIDDNLYGFQAKYHDPDGCGNVFTQIKDSLKKIVDKVNIVYIYTNYNIKFITTNKNKDKVRNSQVVEIEQIAKSKNIEIKWVTGVTLNEIIQDNIDILQLFFGEGNEIDLLINTLKNEKSFLLSQEFVDLPLDNNETINSFASYITNSKNNKFIITGQPGSGKSEMIKRLFCDFSGSKLELREQVRYILENKILPVVIDLKSCADDNLYRIVREKLGDNYISLTKTCFKIVYLLDGLDEIIIDDVMKICINIERLLNEQTTHKIVISCRSNSYNLIYLKDKLEFEETSIRTLDINYINTYFNIRKNKTKNIKLNNIMKKGNLLKEINDIFSIALLWDVIEKANENTSKVELISMKIKSILNLDNSKLLMPSYDSFIEINKEIAYVMQENMKLCLTIEDLQMIIMKKYDRLNYSDVNDIVNQLIAAYFETTDGKYGRKTVLSYVHRMYQEYFLYLKVKDLFFEDPLILRRLNIVSNKDFLLGIFVEQGLKESLYNKEYIKSLSFYFLIAYLPESYLKEYKKKELFNVYSGFGIEEPSYTYSNEFIYALACQDDIKLEYILNDENIDIDSFFNNEERLLEFIEVFHRYNKNKIHQKLIDKFQYIISQKDNKLIEKIAEYNIYSTIYYCGIILRKTTDILKKEFLEKYRFDHSLRISSFERIAYLDEKAGRAFLKFMLEFRIDDLIDLIPQVNNYLFSIWCDEFFKPNNLIFLFSIESLKQAVRNKLESIDDYTQYDLSILILRKFLGLQVTDEAINILEKEWSKINNEANYPRWEQRWERNIVLTYILNKKNKLLFNELKAYISIFEIMINYLQHDINDSEVLRLMNKAIENEEKSNNWFKYEKSQLIGVILSKISFSTKFEYYLAGNIIRYNEKINNFAVLYTLKRNSAEAFKRIVNLELIDLLYNNLVTSDEYYDSISELYLKFSFMKAEMDSEGSYLLILKSFNNTLFRAGFRKDDLVSYKLLDLLEGVTLRHWYSFSEMELFIDKTYKMLNILNEATDGNGRKEAFNNLIVEYYPSLKEQYNITEDYNSVSNSYMYEKRCLDENSITLDNLYELYCGESKDYRDINYGMLDTWITLVNKEIEITGGIDLVFKFLDKVKYPNSYIATNGENCYLAVAAILNNANFKEKAMEYVCRKGGREGLISIIKSYIELNDSINGKPMFEMFFKLCELLIYY